MPAPKEILDLVARFEMHVEAYKAGQYNETQLRRDYLDPFFKALGWDIDNTAGHAEARTPQEQTALDRQIQSTDAQIDRLVSELYGLTEEEIGLVEGTATPATEGIPTADLESKSALPPGQSTAQSEADAAHHYSFKEEPPTYGTEENAKPREKGE